MAEKPPGKTGDAEKSAAPKAAAPAAPSAPKPVVRSAPWDPAAAFRERNKTTERPAPERPATLAAHRRNVEARRELGLPKKGAVKTPVVSDDDED
jgi:hypothetical protein